MECGFRCRRTLSQLHDASRYPTLRRYRCYTVVGSSRKEGTDWKRWNRMMMEFRPPPYAATQGSKIVEEFIRGYSLDPSYLLY